MHMLYVSYMHRAAYQYRGVIQTELFEYNKTKDRVPDFFIRRFFYMFSYMIFNLIIFFEQFLC